MKLCSYEPVGGKSDLAHLFGFLDKGTFSREGGGEGGGRGEGGGWGGGGGCVGGRGVFGRDMNMRPQIKKPFLGRGEGEVWEGHAHATPKTFLGRGEGEGGGARGVFDPL